jgi:hypothetical protein
MYVTSDVSVILKAGRSRRVANNERALPLIIEPCPAVVVVGYGLRAMPQNSSTSGG